MDTLIVYVDDAAHAWGILEPLRSSSAAVPRQWIVVACAPRVTHHMSKWVTHSARENWRGKWADKLFAQLLPRLHGTGQQVLACTGKNNLAQQTDGLLQEHGPARVIDARRPKLGLGLDTQPTPRPPDSLLGACFTLMGTGLLLAD